MNRPNMKVNIAGVELSNPITVASGTFSYDMCDYVDFNQIGAICLKGIFNKPKLGNPTPRIAEVTSGAINSVGLQGSGVDAFITDVLPKFKGYSTKIIANVCGNDIDEYCEVAEKLGTSVDMLEINVSCPNVKEGCMAFGTNAKMIEKVTSAVKKSAKRPIIIKLSPNVTDITEMAKAAESGGADALSMINTILSMKIDVKTRRPINASNVGGLSGPAIKPIAVRMVWQAANAVSIPIIGMGGIMSGEDAAEFMLAGATAVAVGTANLIRPNAAVIVKNELEEYLIQNDIDSVQEIIGGIIAN